MLTQKELSEKQGDCVPDPMPPTKIQAFMEEFPWVKKHVHAQEPIIQVYVSRMESSFLNYSPEEFDIGDVDHVKERIFLLNEENEVVTAEVERRRKKFFLFGPVVSEIKKIYGIVSHDSLVGSTVERFEEKADSIHFILSYYGHTEAVIIYKLPKGVSLKQWIENEIKQEKEKLRSEVTATT